MTIQKITQLRKDGFLDEAYSECFAMYNMEPGNRFYRVGLFKCLKALMEEAASECDYHRVASLLHEMQFLKLEEIGEEHIANRICWGLLMLFRQLKQNPEANIEAATLIFTELKQLRFQTDNPIYVKFVEAFLLVRGLQNSPWMGFCDFMDWWGFGNFTPENFERYVTRNGQSTPSVAERAYNQYFKTLRIELMRRTSPAGRVEKHIGRLDNLIKEQRAYSYTLYHKGILRYHCGNREDAVSTLKRAALSRMNDNKMWSALAMAVEDDEMALNCLCQALQCPAAPPFTVDLHRRASDLMFKRGDFAYARRELEIMMDIYSHQGWTIGPEFYNATHSDWFINACPENLPSDYYRHRADEARRFVLESHPETTVLITRIIRPKRICSFITPDMKRGYFIINQNMRVVLEQDHLIKLRIISDVYEDLPTKVMGVRDDDSGNKYAGLFFKEFEGPIRIAPTRKYALLEDVFFDGRILPPQLVDGTHVWGRAHIYFNLKRNDWNWRASTLFFDHSLN